VFPLLSFLLLWLYAGIAGFRPPVTRAALMLSFFFLGELFERDVSGFSSLSMAALLLLFLNPSNLFDASFQLSFAATAGIIFVVQRYRLADGKNLAKGVVICGLGAQVSVLPLIIYHFGIFYPAGFISNILFFPLAGLVVIAFPLLLLMPFLFVPVRMLLSFFLYSVTLVAQISPGIKVSLSLPLLILSYVFLLLLFADMGIKRKACALSAVFCGAMILAVLPSLLPFRENKLYILSAGKPAAVFVDDREAACFFSDSHRPPEVENVLIPFLKTRKGVRSFNLFYNDITYNHAGTLKAIGKAVEPWTVFEHESAGNEPFYDYYKKIFQGFPAMDFRLMKTGDRESLCAMEVEFLGEDGGRLAYLARKGEETILIAPYVGEVISRKLAGRTFTIAYISDFRNTADIRNVLGCTRYGYLVLPKKLKKFSVLNVPDGKTLYLSNGAVVTDFSAEPFAVSYYRDAFTADFRRNWKRLFFPGFLRREGLSLR